VVPEFPAHEPDGSKHAKARAYLSGRHFRRQCARYEAEGVEGLRDKRLLAKDTRCYRLNGGHRGWECDGSRPALRSCINLEQLL
jgi:hypothetical protein